MLLQLLTKQPTLDTSMYGVGSFIDSPEREDYNPFEHAELLKARIITNNSLPEEMAAAYSHELHVIFLKPDLPVDVEWCGLSHEIVHYERRDRGKSPREEARANRISTLRMVRPSRVAATGLDHSDLPAIARELNLTQQMMELYSQMARTGALPTPPQLEVVH